MKLTTSPEIELFENSAELCSAYIKAKETMRQINQKINERFYTDSECYRITFKETKIGDYIKFGFIMIFVFLFLCMLSLNFLENTNFKEEYILPYIFITLTIGFILGIILKIILTHRTAKSVTADYKFKREHAIKDRNELIKTKPKLDKEMIYLETDVNNEEINCIPKKYWHVAHILFSYIKNKRAYDIYTAINVYEEEMYRFEMLRRQNAILANTEEAKYHAQYAAEQGELANKNSRIAVIMGALTLYNSMRD